MGCRLALEPFEILQMHTRAAAHELKNVFGHLTLYLDLLQDETESDLIDNLRQSLSLGATAARNLMRLAAASRRAEGPIDPKLVLGEFQRLAQEVLPGSVGLTTSYSEDLWTARCRMVRLYSELGRLLGEAARALSAGGSIVIRAENRTVPGTQPTVDLVVAAFPEPQSSEKVEAFLSQPLPAEAQYCGLESADGSECSIRAAIPEAVVSWRLHLPAFGTD